MALGQEAQLLIKIAAEDLTGPAFQQTETKMGKLKSVAGAVAGALAGAGTASLVGALGAAARAANDDEVSVAALTQAVENSGASWDDNAAAIEARIKAGQNLAFTDDEIRGSLATLITSTGDVTAALDLQKIAMDVARAKHVSLETASLAVGKASEGEATSLKRLTGVAGDTGSAAESLAEVQRRTAGQAEKYGETTSAAVFKTKDALGEFIEEIGRGTGPMQGLLSSLPEISSGMTIIGTAAGGATPYIKDHIAELANLGKTLAKGGIVLIAIGLVIEAFDQVKQTLDWIGQHWEWFVNALKTGKLNEIPVFGFFFHVAQDVLGMIQGIQNAWQSLQIMLGNTAAPGGQGGFGRHDIPEMATGGIVTRPTLAMIGERGPEAVIPLGRGGMAGGGVNLTVNVGSVDSEQRIEELTGRISDLLMRQLFAQRSMNF